MTELAGQKEPTIVHLVPHTHWDREWYEPFQTFRLRLVELIDQLLVRMEGDQRHATGAISAAVPGDPRGRPVRREL